MELNHPRSSLQIKKMRSNKSKEFFAELKVLCKIHHIDVSRKGLDNNNHPNPIQNQERLKHRNQRWVHLPLSICEALRGFGRIQIVCSNAGEKRKKKTETGERSLRRHVDLGEKIEIEEEKWEVNDCVVEEEEEESRVSICIPPKNALLLMRCRSDPMRMSALTNRLRELQSAPEEEEDDEDEDLVMEVQEDEKENPEDKLEIIQEKDDNEEEEEKQQVSSLSEAFADPEKLENEEEEKEDASNLIQERESHHSSSTEDETEEF
ncbi:hypothetical protein LOK49_LG10G02229 [Camellia lanceoleosa]|uniref:Uncharacterized protein n=1 Tax=Camellia lanceoleosa TaxID=1840588 RepID=A0ACC0GET6_9ERIC|nr:hypothetical protein LOK49_LG10G02229 [Camellia lanceoleosa]